MANLNNISASIKQFLWLIILVALGVIFGLLITIRYLFVKQKVPSLPQVTAPQFESLPASNSNFKTSNLSAQSAPANLPIYSVNKDADYLIEANMIAQKLGFTEPPHESDDINLGRGLIFANENSVLSVFKNKISYQKSTALNQPVNLNLDSLNSKAVEFISNLNLGVGISSQPQVSYSKFAGEGAIETTDPQEASLITLTFGETINSVKIIGDIFGIRITLNPSGDVTGFVLNKVDLASQETQYPLINLNAALSLLEINSGSLIKISGAREDIETVNTLAEVDLQNAYVAYYLPTKSVETIQPVWAFEGGSTADGLKVNVTYTVPAIRSEYLSGPEP